MSNKHTSLTDILIKRGLTTEQRAERSGLRLQDALVRLEYVTPDGVLAAVAVVSDLIDLTDVVIPLEVIELMPESVARENRVLPLALHDHTLFVAMSDPSDFETLQKLQFILNKDIRPILAPRDQIIEAINRHYGQSETESVDSMLCEFTDTAIDLTETEASSVAGMRPETSLDSATGPTLPARQVSRRATVRHYHRMNPERMFPLLVVLSENEIRAVARKGVGQASSGPFRVAAGSVVEIEPILPGCACYPPREQVTISEGKAEVTFWVVPHVLGRVMQARVVVRQDAKLLAEVPLDVYVARQALTALLGALTLCLPMVFVFLRHFRLDLESQLSDGFDVYMATTLWLLGWLSPGVIAGMLFVATACVYLWRRPRQRDVFWDVEPVVGEAADPPVEEAPPADRRARLLEQAERLFAREDYEAALRFYESAFGMGAAKPVEYHHASLAAFHMGDAAQALAILQEAEARLPDRQMKGSMWYNMGCFATRLGRFEDALHYLNRAVDAGFTDARKYRTDPDLSPLRWRPAFKALLYALDQNALTR